MNSGDANCFKQINEENFDLEIYKKFLLFIKFQEMMEEYNT